MVEGLQHLKTGAHDAPVPFDRLVRISVRADRNRGHAVPFGAQFPRKYRGRIRARHQLGFEVEPRRQPQPSVTGPCKTVNAPVFTAAVGVDRAIKRQIWRRDIIDQASGVFFGNLGPQDWGVFGHVPSVVDIDALKRLKSPGFPAVGPPPLTLFRFYVLRVISHCAKIEQNKNILKQQLRWATRGRPGVGPAHAHVGFHQVETPQIQE